MSEAVEIQRKDELAVVTLNDELLDHKSWDGIRRAALQLSDAPPRAVVLTGSTCFSRGLDPSAENSIVRELVRLGTQGDTYRLAERVKTLRDILLGFSRLPCPVIAAIEGPCLGEGFELALTADLRVAGAGSVFGLPGIRYGTSPLAGGLVNLHHLLSPARANELVLTGRIIDAATAQAWGLLNRVVERGGAVEAALELARDITRSERQPVLQATLASRSIARGAADVFDIETQAAARTLSTGTLERGLTAWRASQGTDSDPRGDLE